MGCLSLAPPFLFIKMSLTMVSSIPFNTHIPLALALTPHLSPLNISIQPDSSTKLSQGHCKLIVDPSSCIPNSVLLLPNFLYLSGILSSCQLHQHGSPVFPLDFPSPSSTCPQWLSRDNFNALHSWTSMPSAPSSQALGPSALSSSLTGHPLQVLTLNTY